MAESHTKAPQEKAPQVKAPQVKATRTDSRAETARHKLCEATIEALDRYGYGDASINRVQEISGVSRGALTHHFASKQRLIAATADHLLRRAVVDGQRFRRAAEAAAGLADGAGATTPPQDETALVIEVFAQSWERVVNTKEGRALIEILVATRTDAALRAEIEQRLYAWDDAMSEAILDVFESPRGEADLRLVWGVCRTFLRGLILQEPFLREPAERAAFVRRFAEMAAPYLRLKR